MIGVLREESGECVARLSPSCKHSATMHRHFATGARRAHHNRRRLRLASVALAAALLTGSVMATGAGADELSDKRARAEQVASQLDALQEKVESLDEQAEIAKGELMAAEAAVADAQARADHANAEAQRYSAQLRTFSVDAYVNGNTDPQLDAMLTSTSSEAPRVKGYLHAATSSRADMIDQFQGSQSQAERETASLSDAQAELDALNAQLQRSLDDAQAAVDEQSSIKASLDSEIAGLVAEEQARKAAAAEAAAQARAAQAAAQAPTSSRAPAATGGAAAPAPGAANDTGGGYTPPSAPAPAPGTPVPDVPSGAAGAVQAAMSRIGMPYVWAAAGPDAFDCSGLTSWAWAQAGRSLGHYTGSQYAQSRRISEGDLQPGDLVFFWAPGAGGDPSHVGLYIGGGAMVHAPGRGRNVTTAGIHYWPGARLAFGRI